MAAKKKTAKPYGNKTHFVMSLPRDLSAKAVVDQAKKAGIVISEAHVYKIRSTNKEKAPSKSAKGAAKSAKVTKKAAGRSSGASEKRDFVLSFSANTPASEILRKAKESGIGLSKAYLYTIRASTGGKPQGRGASKEKPSAKAAPASKGRGASNSGSLESQFVNAALDLGLARAAELLDRVRARLKGF